MAALTAPYAVTFILIVTRLAGLQSNVPALAGYTRCHWPLTTCAITSQADGGEGVLALERGEQRRPVQGAAVGRRLLHGVLEQQRHDVSVDGVVVDVGDAADLLDQRRQGRVALVIGVEGQVVQLRVGPVGNRAALLDEAVVVAAGVAAPDL